MLAVSAIGANPQTPRPQTIRFHDRQALTVVQAAIGFGAVPPDGQPPLNDLMAMVPFAATLGIELVSATPEEVVGRLAWREELCTTGGAMHGGALMSLADNLGGLCAYLNLPAGAGTATISSSTNFLRGLREGNATATARPLRVGRTVIVVQTELRDDAGRLITQTTQAQAVIRP
jgi:1,4-dihydroxy-2-naphthoyl-CoA hydrolase